MRCGHVANHQQARRHHVRTSFGKQATRPSGPSRADDPHRGNRANQCDAEREPGQRSTDASDATRRMGSVHGAPSRGVAAAEPSGDRSDAGRDPRASQRVDRTSEDDAGGATTGNPCGTHRTVSTTGQPAARSGHARRRRQHGRGAGGRCRWRSGTPCGSPQRACRGTTAIVSDGGGGDTSDRHRDRACSGTPPGPRERSRRGRRSGRNAARPTRCWSRPARTDGREHRR